MDSNEAGAAKEHPSQLATALTGAAAELGVDLGPVVQEGAGARTEVDGRVTGERFLALREGSTVLPFDISLWSRGGERVQGPMADLRQVAQVAHAWRSGASFATVHTLCPFLESGALRAAMGRGPAEAVAVKWRMNEVRARHFPVWSHQLPLLIAGYAEPRLRRLFPVTSHFSLWLSGCVEYPHLRLTPLIEPLRDGRHHIVHHRSGRERETFGSAEEAVARVAALLPADIGPAAAGSAASPRG